jgi:hypothetical protein
MKPTIEGTGFGYIVIDGETIEHDVTIDLSGRVRKRKKKLSKAVYGTSHTVSRDEVKHVYEKGAERLIVGTGQQGVLAFSEEAAAFLRKHDCHVDLHPTPKAIECWNRAEDAVIGLFHITC